MKCKKRKFKTLKQAEIAIGNLAINGSEQSIYICPNCGYFHTTSHPRNTPPPNSELAFK